MHRRGTFQARTRLNIAAAIVIIASISFGICLALRSQAQPGFASEIASVIACVRIKDSIGCARPLVQKLLRTHKASEIVDTLAASNITQGQCHYFSHVVGQETYLKYRNTEKALAECNRSCGVACAHGVIGETFVTEAGLKDEAVDAEHLSVADVRRTADMLCKTSNTCHGVGHVLFLNTRSFSESLAACDEVATGRVRGGCYTGVFMEFSDELNAKNAWGTRTTVVRPTIRALDDFCDGYTLDQKRACYWYLPFTLANTYSLHEIPLSSNDISIHILQICALKSGQDRRACVFGGGARQYQLLERSPEKVVAFCEQFSDPADKASCFYGATSLSSNFTSMSKLVAFCGAIPENNIRRLCYQDIYLEVRATPELGESVARVKALCSWADSECRLAADHLDLTAWEAITAAFPL